MTREEILQKSVKKTGLDVRDWTVDSNPKWWFTNNHYYLIIFSHKFAKSLWGKRKEHVFKSSDFGEKCKICKQEIENFNPFCKGFEGWKYHLQQMVLEEDPIKYLEQFI